MDFVFLRPQVAACCVQTVNYEAPLVLSNDLYVFLDLVEKHLQAKKDKNLFANWLKLS